jgi:NAD(P)-dependent dehydrogenase (short-subunit alcohol dehydrogenase family)
MPNSLAGKTVIVTGAGRGLGRAYARAAARAGASVLVNDIDPVTAAETVDLIGSAGGVAEAHVASVADPDAATDMVARAVSSFGRLDGLVNNAGILSPGAPVDQAEELVRRTIATNLLGPWWCGAAAMRVMLAAGSGSIVNVVSGAMQGLPDMSLYGTTKGAVMGMTYGWALELAGTGVRVNAISPLAQTPMSGVSGTSADIQGGSPDGVAPAVVFLLSDRAARLNGQIVRFDGDRLGIVEEPHLAVRSESKEWSDELIADAFDGAFAERLRPLGLAQSPVPDVIRV